MHRKQCRYFKNSGKRCSLKTSNKKHFCTIHQNSMHRFSNDKLMQEIVKTTRGYLRLTPEHQIACMDPDNSSQLVPDLANLIYEAINRGYRYKDVKTLLMKTYNDWRALRHLPIVRQAP